MLYNQAQLISPKDYCTPRQPSPHLELPKFDDDENDKLPTMNDGGLGPAAMIRGPSSAAISASKQVNSSPSALSARVGGIKTPALMSKSKLFVSSGELSIIDGVRTTAALRSRRPRSVSSEGIYNNYSGTGTFARKSFAQVPARKSSSNSSSSGTHSGAGTISSVNADGRSPSVHLAGPSFSSGSSSSSSASKSVFFISPERKAVIMRKRKRSPGGHLLVPMSMSPTALHSSAGRRVSKPKRGRPLMARIEEADNHEKRGSFVRVVTPLRKRMRRSRLDPKNMTESQKEKLALDFD
jgi:hypothetical protein